MSIPKAERLLNLIAALLDTRRPLTVEEIRATVAGYEQQDRGSFKRMFERDKEELREMGIPIERKSTDAWELEEGYLIPKERYQLPELDLSADELTALWLAAGVGRFSDPETAHTTWLKLSHQFPEMMHREALSWLAADTGLQAPGLAVCFDATIRHKRLLFDYNDKHRRVDPYGLVHRKGGWYLVGLDQGSGEMRSFRLNRIQNDVRLQDPTAPGGEFAVPPDFHPEEMVVPRETEGGPEALVRFSARQAWWAERHLPWAEPTFDELGRVLVRLPIGGMKSFVSWVLGFGDSVEVLEPVELRSALAEHLSQICARQEKSQKETLHKEALQPEVR